MDQNIKNEIMSLIENTKFGKITIELNEANDHIDVKVEKTERVFKKTHIPKQIIPKIKHKD